MRIKNLKQAFTLVELLVVIAITSILLTVIFKPLFDSYRLTSRAGTQIESQTAGRDTMREVSNLLSNAAFVFDNAQTPINVWLQDKDKNSFARPMAFAMVEYVAPARQLDQRPGDAPIDPTTGKPIYDSSVPDNAKKFSLPLVPGRVLGRIFIGLNDNRAVPTARKSEDGTDLTGEPVKPYANRWEDPQTVDVNADNRYNIFKAEALVYIPDPEQVGSNRDYVPNLGLFHTRNASGQLTMSKTDTVELHDPNFFYDASLAGGTGDLKWAAPAWRDLNGDGKVQIFENWRAISSGLMPAPKVDMVVLDRQDCAGYPVLYDANGKPTARPLAQFTPAFFQNDPGVPTALEAAGVEMPASDGSQRGFAPSGYRSQYSHWATPYRVSVYRNETNSPQADPLSLPTLNYYETEGNGSIYSVTRAPGDPQPARGPDVGPRYDPVRGKFLNPNPAFAFAVDHVTGQIRFDFPQSVLVRDLNDNPAPQRYSPADINAALTGDYRARYLILSNLPANLNAGNAVSPLRQFATDLGSRTPRVRIVPGSERVFGPDMRPGPHYGHRIQYTRASWNVAPENLGANEYRIRYEDGPNAENVSDENDPRLRVGYIEFNSLPKGFTKSTSEDPSLEQYGVNALPELKMDPISKQNVAADPVEVEYRFQMNRPNDVVKIDYMTRELMNVSIQSRLYDPSSARPQIIELTNKIKVRNLQR